MKAASPFAIFCLGVWVLIHLIGLGIASLFLNAIMGIHFDSIHTSNTGMDPIRGLTSETVVQNIWTLTWRCTWVVPVAAISVYFISDVLWEHLGKTGKRIALFLGLLCAVMLAGAMVTADIRCFLKYPQR